MHGSKYDVGDFCVVLQQWQQRQRLALRSLEGLNVHHQPRGFAGVAQAGLYQLILQQLCAIVRCADCTCESEH